MKKITVLILTLLLTLSFAGCGKKDNPDENLTNVSEYTGTSDLKDGYDKLVVGVVPDVSSLPLFVAEKNGYFDGLGIDVELKMLTSMKESRLALQDGTVDGAFTDLITVFIDVADGFKIKATTSVDISYPLVIREGYDGSSETLKVGVIKENVINYLTDLYLGNSSSIEKIYVDELSEGLLMIQNGQIDMMAMPEPLASLLETSGMRKDVYAIENNYSPCVLAFTDLALYEKPAEIELLNEAYDKAVEEINLDSSNLNKQILMEKFDITEEAAEKTAFPVYAKTRTPNGEIIANILEWIKDALKKDIPVS